MNIKTQPLVGINYTRIFPSYTIYTDCLLYLQQVLFELISHKVRTVNDVLRYPITSFIFSFLSSASVGNNTVRPPSKFIPFSSVTRVRILEAGKNITTILPLRKFLYAPLLIESAIYIIHSIYDKRHHFYQSVCKNYIVKTVIYQVFSEINNIIGKQRKLRAVFSVLIFYCWFVNDVLHIF